MKRVLNITATNGGTTTKVRIEVNCREDGQYFLNRRQFSGRVLHTIASEIMQAVSQADYFKVPLSRQRVGR